jgi:hypothetical protein
MESNFLIYVILVSYSALSAYHFSPDRKRKEIILAQSDRFQLPQCPMKKKKVTPVQQVAPISPMNNSGVKQVKKVVVVTKIIYVAKPKKEQSLNSVKRIVQKPIRRIKEPRINVIKKVEHIRTPNDQSVEKKRRKYSIDDLIAVDPIVSLWKKGKPKLPDKEYEDNKDYFEKSQAGLKDDFHGREAPRNSIKIGNSRRSDFKIMEDRVDSDDSGLFLDMIEEEKNYPPSLRMQSSMNFPQSHIVNRGEEDFIIERSKKRCIFFKMKNRISEAFKRSFEDPVARLFVAIALGLITTIGLCAIVSLFKILTMKKDDFEHEYEGREYGRGPYHYWPLPQQPA